MRGQPRRSAVPCAVCGAPCPGLPRPPRLCSAECARLWRNRGLVARAAAERSARQPKTCPICGESFAPKWPYQKFCSSVCRVQSHIRVQRVKIIAVRGVSPPCSFCGGPLRHWKKGTEQPACNRRECQNARRNWAFRNRPAGPNSRSWKWGAARTRGEERIARLWEMVRLMDSGLTTKQVASTMGVAVTTVAHARQLLGAPPRPSRPSRPPVGVFRRCVVCGGDLWGGGRTKYCSARCRLIRKSLWRSLDGLELEVSELPTDVKAAMIAQYEAKKTLREYWNGKSKSE